MLIQLKNIVNLIIGFFLFGIALLIMITLYDFMTTYRIEIFRLFYLVMRFFAVMLPIAISLVLLEKYTTKPDFIDSTAIEIKSENEENDNDRIIALYEKMNAENDFSWNKLALLVYGKKGGHYTSELKNHLTNAGYEV